MITQNFPFTTPGNYNVSNVLVDSGIAKLALIPNPGQLFSNTFDDDTGFTYDNTKAEFVAGILRQKDQTPANSILGATFDTLVNASWNKDGALTATLTGTPTIVGNRLQCFGVHGVRYSVNNVGQGAVKFKYVPNYTGAPATNENIVAISNTNGNSRVRLTHSPSGNNLRVHLVDNSGVVLLSTVAIGGTFATTSGVAVEIELNWDNVAGTIRIFVNGTLHGTLSPGAWAHGTGAGYLYAGASADLSYNIADASFDDLLFFEAVQHTATYVAGYTVPGSIYAGSKIDGPNFVYSGVGTVLSVDDGTITESGAPRYIVGLQYWDGAAWVLSNGTYAQANDFATILANLGAFDTGGGGVLPWSVVFTDSNTQGQVDAFEVEVTGQKYSPDGYVEPVQSLQVSALISMALEFTETANALLKIILRVDGVLKYWDGASWVTSNGTFAQANTLADFNANIDDLNFGVNSTVFVRWVFNTTVNVETAELDDATISYNFGGVETEPSTCIVFGYLKDIGNNPISGAKVNFTLKRNSNQYSEANKNVVLDPTITVKSNAEGYFSAVLIRSSEYEGAGATYEVDFEKGQDTIKNSLTFLVPDAETKDITDLLTAS